MEERFAGYLSAIGQMSIDSIQAYTYPKLFNLITPAASRESMLQSYNFFNNNARLDSVKRDLVFPVFAVEKARYAKVVYSMHISIPSDSAENDKSQPPADTISTTHSVSMEHYPAPRSTLMATLIRNNTLGIDVTRYEEKGGTTILQFRVMAIAVKNEFSDKWSFISVTNDQELLNKLFSKKVLERLALDKNQL